MTSNKELIDRFLLVNGNLAETTRAVYRSTLTRLSASLGGKSFRELNVKDLDAFLKARPAAITRVSNLWRIRCFLRWLYDDTDDPLPKDLERYSVRYTRKKIRPEDLLTPDEVRRLLDACSCLRDKTLVALLWATGCRISELRYARVKDVSDDEPLRIIVNGKTGEHESFIKAEVGPLLKQWLTFLQPASKDQPLFPPHHDLSKPIDYSTVRRILAKAAKRAGITKRVHCHIFRHGRVTELIRSEGRDKAKLIMAYAPNSNAFDAYDHLTSQDRKNAFLASESKAPPTPQGPQPLPAASYVHPLARDNTAEIEALRKKLDETNRLLNEMTDKVIQLVEKQLQPDPES